MDLNKKLSVAAFAVFISSCAVAALEFGTPFSDGAVLQRDRKVPVWGIASPGAEVTVAFAGNSFKTAADEKGGWRVDLPPMPASKESRVLSAVSGGEKAEARDILVGEVWFASGQSNMECPIWGTRPRYRDGKGSLVTQMTRLPCVRFAKNQRAWNAKPARRLKAVWCKMTPENFTAEKTMKSGNPSTLSAVAYYFARELYLALDVPVGIVDSSWGGTNIDAWTPRAGYEGCDPSIAATATRPVKEKPEPEELKAPVSKPWQQPTVLWNGMVESWAPMAMRGFIWYQGCHNSDHPESSLYCAKMHALYNGWSRRFENPGLKLYFCQLAPYRKPWMQIIAQQTKFINEEKNAGMAVLADAGNFFDIHPNDKETVAKRLAALALKRDYGFSSIDPEPPVVKNVTAKGHRIFIEFDKDVYIYNNDFSGKALFEVAGADGKWAPATVEGFKSQAHLGKRICLSSKHIKSPAKVRYLYIPPFTGSVFGENSIPLAAFEANVKKGKKQ